MQATREKRWEMCWIDDGQSLQTPKLSLQTLKYQKFDVNGWKSANNAAFLCWPTRQRSDARQLAAKYDENNQLGSASLTLSCVVARGVIVRRTDDEMNEGGDGEEAVRSSQPAVIEDEERDASVGQSNADYGTLSHIRHGAAKIFFARSILRWWRSGTQHISLPRCLPQVKYFVRKRSKSADIEWSLFRVYLEQNYQLGFSTRRKACTYHGLSNCHSLLRSNSWDQNK